MDDLTLNLESGPRNVGSYHLTVCEAGPLSSIFKLSRDASLLNLAGHGSQTFLAIGSVGVFNRKDKKANKVQVYYDVHFEHLGTAHFRS